MKARREAVQQVRSKMHRPRLLWVRSRILVHGPREEEGPDCTCCGSRLAVITQEIEDCEVLIDLEEGRRINRADAPEWFDEVKHRAHEVVIPLRCSESQLPLLRDDEHKVVAAFGGNRSGKTTIGVYWLVRQWLRRGGQGAHFWCVAPGREQSHTLLNKLLLGEFSAGRTPPALPLADDGKPLLATYWPRTLSSPDQWVDLVDGSRITLHHARYDGRAFRGKAVQSILFDEATAVSKRENWTILMMRLTESRGQMFVSTTPLPGHWMKDEIVDRTDEAASDIHQRSLSQTENPWVPQDEVDRQIRLINDDRRVAIEVHGLWLTNKGGLWKHFDDVRHVLDGDSYDVTDYLEGVENVTKQVIGRVWAGRNPYTSQVMAKNLDYIAGQDFNTDFMNVVIAQAFLTMGGKLGLFVVDEVVLREATASRMAGWLMEERGRRTRMRSYPRVPISCDATGAYYSVSHVASDKYAATDALYMSRGGFDCRPCRHGGKNRSPQNPAIHDSVSLVQAMLREGRLFIHSRCRDLLNGIRNQEDDGRGRPVKVSGTRTDRLSGPVDALRYLVWPIFSSEAESRPVQLIAPRRRGVALDPLA